MTAEQRQLVRATRDHARRLRIEIENQDDGAPDCAYCGGDIVDRKPRKRFCCAEHKRTFWLKHTPNGRARRKESNRRYYANRVAA